MQGVPDALVSPRVRVGEESAQSKSKHERQRVELEYTFTASEGGLTVNSVKLKPWWILRVLLRLLQRLDHSRTPQYIWRSASRSRSSHGEEAMHAKASRFPFADARANTNLCPPRAAANRKREAADGRHRADVVVGLSVSQSVRTRLSMQQMSECAQDCLLSTALAPGSVQLVVIENAETGREL